MKKVSLSGFPRESVGKKDAKSLRRAGKVPCVVYGGKEQFYFSLDESAVKKVVFSPEVFQYEISVEGKAPVKAVIKDLQFHPVSDRVEHVDFLELLDGKEAKIQIPLRMVGVSPGVRGGGRLAVLYRKIMAKGMPDKFPDAIEVDISELEVGDKKRVEDISWDGLSFIAPKTDVVVSVKTARVLLVEEVEGVEGAEGAEGAEGTEGAEGAEGTAPADGATPAEDGK